MGIMTARIEGHRRTGFNRDSLLITNSQFFQSSQLQNKLVHTEQPIPLAANAIIKFEI